MDDNDIRVIQTGNSPRFLQEPPPLCEIRPAIAPQELQGHGPAQACVCRLKYFAHATDTDQAFEEIRPDLISGSEWHRRILRTLPASGRLLPRLFVKPSFRQPAE